MTLVLYVMGNKHAWEQINASRILLARTPLGFFIRPAVRKRLKGTVQRPKSRVQFSSYLIAVVQLRRLQCLKLERRLRGNFVYLLLCHIKQN